MTSSTEKRTQIYLTAEQHRRATDLARRQGTSLAAVVRESLEQYIATSDAGPIATWEGDPVTKLLGALELPQPSPTDLDDVVDEVVYGEEL